MRSILTLSFLACGLVSSAQTLFSEDFESSPAFMLNTADAGSTSGISNTWSINTVYAGGDGVADCLGFPIDFSIAATPGQPAGITTANGNYLHTASLVAIANGIQCCSFGAADGFCTLADDIFSGMSADVSTIGSPDVSVKFWWLCDGGNQNYGEVWYSTNSGGAWTQLTTPITQYRNQTSWVEQTISSPAFGEQATLRIGFRFHNGESLLGGSDPGFALDDVRIIANTTVNSITCAVGLPAYCAGSSFNLTYTATGTFTAGNVFTAQLSDATGGFGSPVELGATTATTSGVITCFLPGGTAPGTGYRIRVVSSTPPITGTDNGSDITVSALASAGVDGATAVCSTDAPFAMSTGGDPGGTWTAPGGGTSTGTYNPPIDVPGVYTYTVGGNGCPEDVAHVTMTEVQAPNPGASSSTLVCSTGLPLNLNTLLSGADAGGVWYDNGSPFSGTATAAGVYVYQVNGTPPCASDTAIITLQVQAAPNAGENGTATVCINGAPINLMTVLQGNPQTGGTWIGPDNLPHTSLLDPTIDESGLYTYTVAGIEPCEDDQAFVAVIIDPCLSVNEVQADGPTVQWLGNDAEGTVLFSAPGQGVWASEIIDGAGRLVRTARVEALGDRLRVRAGDLAPGLYTLRIRQGEQVAAVRFLR